MHCKACDKLLNDFDLRRRDSETGEHIDLCGLCFRYSEAARLDSIPEDMEDDPEAEAEFIQKTS